MLIYISTSTLQQLGSKFSEIYTATQHSNNSPHWTCNFCIPHVTGPSQKGFPPPLALKRVSSH